MHDKNSLQFSVSFINRFVCDFRNPFNSAPTFPNQAQWNASTDNDFEMASTSMTSAASQAPKVNNHQKQAERMAEDESEFTIIVIILIC